MKDKKKWLLQVPWRSSQIGCFLGGRGKGRRCPSYRKTRLYESLYVRQLQWNSHSFYWTLYPNHFKPTPGLVVKIETQLFFRGSDPEDTIIKWDNFKAENIWDTIFVLCLESRHWNYSFQPSRGKYLFRSLEIICQFWKEVSYAAK